MKKALEHLVQQVIVLLSDSTTLIVDMALKFPVRFKILFYTPFFITL